MVAVSMGGGFVHGGCCSWSLQAGLGLPFSLLPCPSRQRSCGSHHPACHLCQSPPRWLCPLAGAWLQNLLHQATHWVLPAPACPVPIPEPQSGAQLCHPMGCPSLFLKEEVTFESVEEGLSLGLGFWGSRTQCKMKEC